MWEKFMTCFKSNGGKPCEAVKLTELYKRVPPNQRQEFQNFLRKHEEYKQRVRKFPGSMPRIDWKYYEQNVRPEFVSWVKDFQKKYDHLDSVFANRHSMINYANYFSNVDKETAELKKQIAKYKEESNCRIKVLQERLNYIKGLKPYEEMTMEEFCLTRPESAPDFINKPTFWPHLPEEQVPGPMVVHIPEEVPEQDKKPPSTEGTKPPAAAPSGTSPPKAPPADMAKPSPGDTKPPSPDQKVPECSSPQVAPPSKVSTPPVESGSAASASKDCIKLIPTDKNPYVKSETCKSLDGKTGDQLKTKVDGQSKDFEAMAADLAARGAELASQLITTGSNILRTIFQKVAAKKREMEEASKAAKIKEAEKIAASKIQPKPSPEDAVYQNRKGSPDVCQKTIIQGDERIEPDVKPHHANLSNKSGAPCEKHKDVCPDEVCPQKDNKKPKDCRDIESEDRKCFQKLETFSQESTECEENIAKSDCRDFQKLEPISVENAKSIEKKDCENAKPIEKKDCENAKPIEKKDCENAKSMDKKDCKNVRLIEKKDCEPQQESDTEGKTDLRKKVDEDCTALHQEKPNAKVDDNPKSNAKIDLETCEPVFVCTNIDPDIKGTGPKSTTNKKLAEAIAKPSRTSKPEHSNDPEAQMKTFVSSSDKNVITGEIVITEDSSESKELHPLVLDKSKPRLPIATTDNTHKMSSEIDERADTGMMRGITLSGKPKYVDPKEFKEQQERFNLKKTTQKDSIPLTTNYTKRDFQPIKLGGKLKPGLESEEEEYNRETSGSEIKYHKGGSESTKDINDAMTLNERSDLSGRGDGWEIFKKLSKDKMKKQFDSKELVEPIKQAVEKTTEEHNVREDKGKPKDVAENVKSKEAVTPDDMAKNVFTMATDAATLLTEATKALENAKKAVNDNVGLEAAYLSARIHADRALAEAHKAVAAARKLTKRAQNSSKSKYSEAAMLAEKHAMLAKLLAKRALHLKREIAKLLGTKKSK
ncbi:titin [Scaptodrosophila lebanonensis]|uniref:Titin n=1 Tax=Drosophila lebanonensis TaxID=7225 RepID=A0A6J2UA73_DROLE|nr:titin [Scaptodrosophila lebanonensis]